MLLCLLLPLPLSLSYFCFAHLILAGMGMFFFGQALDEPQFRAGWRWAFVFNGALSPADLAQLHGGDRWMPWVVLLVERALGKAPENIFGGAGRGAASAGRRAELTVLTWLAVLVLAVGEIFQRPSRPAGPVFAGADLSAGHRACLGADAAVP